VLIGAIAAAVVFAIVATAFAFWPDDDSRSVHVIAPSTTEAPSIVPTTTPATTIPPVTTTSPALPSAPAPTCPQGEATLEAKEGGGGGQQSTFGTSNVTLVANSCTDVVTIWSGNGATPRWTAAYAPSAAGTTSTASLFIDLYDPAIAFSQASLQLTVPFPGAATPLRGAFVTRHDDRVTFQIAMQNPSPFAVVEAVADDGSRRLAIAFPAHDERDSSCSLNGRTFETPRYWFTASCRTFAPDWRWLIGPSPYTLSVGTGIPNMDHAEYLVTSDHTEEVAGRTARVFGVQWISGYMTPGNEGYFWQFEPAQAYNTFDVELECVPDEFCGSWRAAADAIGRSMRFT
jgi:hypothetical protein